LSISAVNIPTHWQHNLLPDAHQPRVAVIHDGVDTELWRRRKVPHKLGDETIAEDVRVVTYVSRGFEAMLGFDIFMRIADRIAKETKNVLFICVGQIEINGQWHPAVFRQ